MRRFFVVFESLPSLPNPLGKGRAELWMAERQRAMDGAFGSVTRPLDIRMRLAGQMRTPENRSKGHTCLTPIFLHECSRKVIIRL